MTTITSPECEPLLSHSDPEQQLPGRASRRHTLEQARSHTRTATLIFAAVLTILSFLALIYDSYSPATRFMPAPIPPSKHHSTLRNLDLRVLPLGDSITYGYGSSSGNGYRQPLQSLLIRDNNSVSFLGRLVSGSMHNGNNEGYGGAKIHEIRKHEQGWLGKTQPSPNIILLHAGTNDCAWHYDSDGAPVRLVEFVDEILDVCTDDAVVLLVGTLLRSWNAEVEECFEKFNKEMVQKIEQQRGKGTHVAVVDMSGVHDEDMDDFLHPNDHGYRLMAEAWWDGIRRVHDLGWIS